MIALLAGLALGQHYAFPSSPADQPEYYVTAYVDHGSSGLLDWNCDTLTYSGHHGTDLGGGSFPGMDEGRDVNAAAPGVVSAVNDGEFDRCTTADCPGGGGFGNYVRIHHADGNDTLYGHLKQWSVLVGVGDEVGCGDKIGEMGSSGHSTGPHLHFQLYDLWGNWEDPFEGACDTGATHWVTQNGWDELPDLTCDTTWPGCQTVDTLTCDDVIRGRNDDPGSTRDHAFWGCTDFARYTGPELSWRVVTDLDEPVTIRLSGLTADLDLFAIEDFECDGRNCAVGSTNSGSSDEEIVFDAAANQEYALAIDGWDDAVSDFQLTVICNGGLPQTGTGSGTGTGGTATGSTTGGSGTGGTGTATGTGSGPVVIPAEPKGCGCNTSTPPATGLFLVLFPLMRRRR